jgi:hypothetical protein
MSTQLSRPPVPRNFWNQLFDFAGGEIDTLT